MGSFTIVIIDSYEVFPCLTRMGIENNTVPD